MADLSGGHGPATCNYLKCLVKSDAPCPFVADEKPVVVPGHAKGPCQHEWRQYFSMNHAAQSLQQDGFFCVFCLEHRKL